jgi:hypothetical protein
MPVSIGWNEDAVAAQIEILKMSQALVSQIFLYQRTALLLTLQN